MEKNSKNRGLVIKHRKTILQKLQRCLLAAGYLLALSTSAIANGQSCASVFPGTLQSHQPNGEINFDWNAQVLGNSGDPLSVVRINNFSWSMLATCGDNQPCDATGSPSASIDPVIDTGNSVIDLHVNDHQATKVGFDQSNSFRTITVGAGGQLTLQQINGDYRINHVNLAEGATLNLTPGSYWFNRLTLAEKVKINVIGEGTARVFVREGITFPWLSLVNMRSVGRPFSPSKLFLYSEGNVELQTDAQVSAIIYTKQQLNLISATLYGAGSFYHANLGASSQVIHQSSTLAVADLYNLCNKEPGTPNPSDVAACPAVFSNGVQTHGETGSIVFEYNAQLHHASSANLNTKNLTVNVNSNKLSCVSESCTASTQAAPKFQTKPFQYSTSNAEVGVPWMETITLGSNSVEYGTITVGATGTLVVEAKTQPYRIKKLTLAYNATLKLPAGDYWVEKLQLDSGSIIEVVGAGTVRLFVKEPVVIPWMSKINDNSKDAAKFIFYSYSDIAFSTTNSLYGLFYAEGQGQLESGANIQGALSAKNIHLKSESQVGYQSDAVAIAHYGDICGEDNSQPDLTAPVLTLNSVVARTEADTVNLTGTVNEPIQHGSGIASVVVKKPS